MSSTEQIEIVGVWLPNKGAELMAHTTVSELSSRLPGARFRSIDQGSAALRGSLGLDPYKPKRSNRITRQLQHLNWPWLNRRIARKCHPETTHVVDISGFAYGDIWGVEKAQNRAGTLCRLGYPVYMLPQAYGPFTAPGFEEVMRGITQQAAFIAARDKRSHEHLKSLESGRDIPLLPDITFSLDVSGRAPECPESPFACLVLNAKTVDTGAISEEEVLDLYSRAADVLKGLGHEIRIVLHEPQADRALSEKLAAAISAPITEIEDARDLKAYLHRSACIVTGRFHGLVNGLSGGVPSFAVSWSHKYQELLSDFGCSDAIYQGDAAAFTDTIRRIMQDPEEVQSRRERLMQKSSQNKIVLKQMWDDIAKSIASTA